MQKILEYKLKNLTWLIFLLSFILFLIILFYFNVTNCSFLMLKPSLDLNGNFCNFIWQSSSNIDKILYLVYKVRGEIIFIVCFWILHILLILFFIRKKNFDICRLIFFKVIFLILIFSIDIPLSYSMSGFLIILNEIKFVPSSYLILDCRLCVNIFAVINLIFYFILTFFFVFKISIWNFHRVRICPRTFGTKYLLLLLILLLFLLISFWYFFYYQYNGQGIVLDDVIKVKYTGVTVIYWSTFCSRFLFPLMIGAFCKYKNKDK